MKIAEKLSEIKRKESELMRMYDIRDEVIKKTFKDSLLNTESITQKQADKMEDDFMKEKKRKVDEFSLKIGSLISEIVEDKNKINQLNVQLGIDKKLAQIKYKRLELAKLMKLIKSERYLSDRIDVDLWSALGINDRIKKLEASKAKLDAEIQSVNWSNKL